MTAQGWLQIVFYLVVLTALTPLLGAYMARVYQGERVALDRVLGPVERLTYRVLRTDPARQQDWKGYARTTLVFSALFFVALFVILRTQGIHPFNPEGFDSGTWDVTFNTTASFITNTNWQFYGGETTLSYFSQMAGLAVQNFVSAAVGHGRARRGHPRLREPRRRRSSGNFWQDLTRTLLYILLPLSLVGRAGARLAGRDPDAQRLRDATRPSRAPIRPSRSARPPRRSRSSSWAPTAAASST